MSAIYVSDMTVAKRSEGFELRCHVKSDDLPAELRLLIKGVHSTSVSCFNYNWVVVALLLPAMLRGKDIVVGGGLSKRLFASVNLDLQAALCIHDPRLKRIQVNAERTSYRTPKDVPRVGTGFSAGIDSFATLSLFSSANQYAGIHVTDLCTFNVGAMGKGVSEEINELFARYCERTSKYAEQHSLGAISVDSNIDDFFSSLDFQRTHTMRNAAAALSLENIFDYYLYSSAVGLAEVCVARGKSIAFMDPIILPMLSTENLTFISSGAGLDRFHKTVRVAAFKPAYELLDVCVEPAKRRIARSYPNCSRCWKCRRTMISLDAANGLENFRSVFDVDFYRKNRKEIYDAFVVSAFGGNAVDMEVFKIVNRKGVLYLRYVVLKALAKTLKLRIKRYLKRFLVGDGGYGGSVQ